MEKKNKVICGASAYEEKYYFNPEFDKLPKSVKDELKIMCVLYTNDIGGVLTVEISPKGELQLRTESASDDFAYDEIGSVLKIRELQRTKEELFRSLELFYRVIILKDTQFSIDGSSASAVK